MSNQGSWPQAPDWGSGGAPNQPAWGAPPAPGTQPPGSLPSYPAANPAFPPEAPPGMYLEPSSGLLLPSGTQLASSARRIGAYFLSIPLVIITLGIGYMIWGAIVWGRGQTPALQVLGMRCWRPETGRVAGWWWMALREIIGRLVEGIFGFLTLILSFILMLATREHRCIHDMVAGTVVLYDPQRVLNGTASSPS